jgi:hypothetical protein
VLLRILTWAAITFDREPHIAQQNDRTNAVCA